MSARACANENDRHGYIHRWDAYYGHDRFRDVAAMSSDDLIDVSVITASGDHIGRIRDVQHDSDGIHIAVDAGHRNVAWIDSDDLRFDPRDRVVVTDLSADQIRDMTQLHHPRF